MNEFMDKYRQAQEKVEAARNEAREAVKKAFQNGVTALFEELPEDIKTVAWTQYTPHFNDGDPCVFRVYSDEPYINGEYWENFECGEQKEESYTRPDGSVHTYNTYPEADDIMQKVSNFLTNFDDDSMKFMFGDGVMVTLTRGSNDIEVDQYDHD